ncbi:transposase [Pseudomonas khavaziana]|uniref:transposase n=1 Tax=Pseudomonas khavaziana TaxID=2842351 RepID=UPI001CEDEAEA|nr:transposase [Pseudomonas khavaziana]
MRKSYSSEFKLKAASMVLDEGQPVTEVCASLDIGPWPYAWIDQVQKNTWARLR